MKKTFLILSFILVSIVSFAQRQRTTAVFDSDTTTRPKAGFYGIGVRGNKVYFVPPSGTTFRVLNANTHVGTNGQFLFTNGSVNYFSNISISNVTSLQSSLDAKFNTPSGLTANYLSKWTGSTFGNSAVFESGGNVGIGTVIPLEKLHVNGAIITTGSISGHGANRATFSQEGANGAFIQSYGSNTSTMGSYFFRQASSDFSITNIPLFISTTGTIGIGTTTPTSKLQVVGLPTYADNAAATSGGLTAGAFYRTSTGVLMVVY